MSPYTNGVDLYIKQIIGIFALLVLAGCSIYESQGRYQFEEDFANQRHIKPAQFEPNPIELMEFCTQEELIGNPIPEECYELIIE